MHWITAGFLMFFSSIASYLFVRLSVAQKTPSEFVNLFIFGIPAIVWSGMVLITKTNVSVTLYQLFILLILAIFFSYLGNKFSLKSLAYAPNPGYALVISKSYVVFTTLAAVLVFNSVLTVRSAVAIALIVFFSALITIDRKGVIHPTHVRANWLPLSLGAFFCWGMLTLTSKYLWDLGVATLPRLFYSMGLVTIFIAVEVLGKRLHWSRLNISQYLTLCFIGIFSAGFNWFMQVGFATAPNIGFINAMNAASMGFVVIGAAIFFKDDLTLRKFVGVIGVIAGLILLVL